MRDNIDPKKIKEIIFSRYVDRIYPSKERLENVLKSGKKLTLYVGIDPTAPHLHLGHSTNLFLLSKFQELGHKVIFLIGDFTAQIGDPTGRITTRKALTKKEVLENCKNYKKQAGKILDFKTKKNPVKLRFNGKWLRKLTFEEIIKVASNFTTQRMMERDMFQERLKKEKPIWLHEFLYPLIQGYDSLAMNVDVEIGGTDQTFNMLMGRELVKKYKKKEKFVITTPLLTNPKTGKKLMSKTESFIGLAFSKTEMYGKIMALPDEVIIDCFKLCTETCQDEIKKMEESLKNKKTNPKDLKINLAKKIVGIYHGREASQSAETEFHRIFKQKKLPEKISSVKIKEKFLNILELLFRTKLASSKSEAKRLILQKGVKIEGRTESDWRKKIEIKKNLVVQVGKRKFIKLN